MMLEELALDRIVSRIIVLSVLFEIQFFPFMTSPVNIASTSCITAMYISIIIA